MSTAKFEKLIDLIINEDQERAEQLFHEIVVEKSREIYENIIDEDMTTDLIDEISSEEEGMEDMMEEDDEFIDDEEIDGDYSVGEEDEDVDFDMETDVEFDDHHADVGGNEELEDRVVDLEDKLDELMAEFESLMADEDFDDEDVDVDVDVDDEEVIDEGESTNTRDNRAERAGRRVAKDIEYDERHRADESKKGRQEREGLKDLRKSKDERRQAAKDFDKVDKVAEAAEMKKVPVTHHDGSDKSAERSPVDFNSGQKGMASHPVDFDMGGDLQQANGPKKPSNYATKGEGEVKGATTWRNKIGGESSNGSGKGEAAPKPTNKQPAGGDQRSPVPESRRSVRKMIK